MNILLTVTGVFEMVNRYDHVNRLPSNHQFPYILKSDYKWVFVKDDGGFELPRSIVVSSLEEIAEEFKKDQLKEMLK